jgi:hypothetical protein
VILMSWKLIADWCGRLMVLDIDFWVSVLKDYRRS